MKKETTRKNKPGAGRPLLAGERMKEHRITLPDDVAEYLRQVGAGNLSGGIRQLVEWHKGTGNERNTNL